MGNIVLARIDDRLIHGQVAVVWASHVKADMIIVVDDEVAGDPTQQMLLDLAAPQDVETLYLTVDGTLEKISQISFNKRVLIIVRDVSILLKLIEEGLPIKEINIGNMHFKKGKRQITPTVWMDEKDIEAFKKLVSLGIKCEIRRVPSEKGREITEFIQEV
ncbi:MAG: PTS sugar transporter subunit IIB [Caldanaerobacter subterraneus]|nr:PTS sugar transporter subunit IIB [Caldanaerobacter subterraneus]